MSAFLAPRVCWKRSQSSLCSDQCDAATVSVASIARSLLLFRSVLVQSWKSKSQFNKRGLARMASNAQPSGDLSGKLGARASSGNARVSAEICRKDTALKSVNDKSCTDQETARKPYVAPRATRLSPDQAKELLLQRADINDPQVECLLRQIDELRRKRDS